MRKSQEVRFQPIDGDSMWYGASNALLYQGQGPSYIANSLTNYTPARTLRSSDAGLLEVTRSSRKKIGDAAFVNYAPKLGKQTR